MEVSVLPAIMPMAIANTAATTPAMVPAFSVLPLRRTSLQKKAPMREAPREITSDSTPVSCMAAWKVLVINAATAPIRGPTVIITTIEENATGSK